MSASRERDLHGAGGTEPGRVGLGDVVGVGGDAGARRPRRTPSRRGPRRARRTPGRGRQRPRRGRSRRGPCPTAGRRARARRCAWTGPSSGRRRPSAAAWTAASVPPTTTTSARPSRIMSMPEGDRLVAGGARGDGRVHAGLGADGQADVGGRGVRHQHRDRQRRDPTWALLLQRVVVGQQRRDAADAGGHGDPEPLGVDADGLAVLTAETGSPPRPRGRPPARAGRTGRAGGP